MSILNLKNYQKTPVSNGDTILSDWGNKLDRGIFAAVHQGGDTYLDDVITTINKNAAGKIETVEEHVGGLLWRLTELAYTGSALSSSTVTVYGYDENGANQTVIARWTDVINRDSSGVTGTTRTVLV